MKMNSAQIEQTLQKLNAEELNAEAIPAGHPMISQLERLFGDHTYFLDSNGLSIVEPLEADHDDGPLGVVVNLAHWTDDSAGSLQPHAPEATELVVDLQADRRH
jgi:hypothetical protein